MRGPGPRPGRLRAAASHPMASTALARLGSLLPISIATFVLSKVVIDHYGVPVFNGYALMMSTMALLPLADLGIGTAVTNAFAIHGPDHPQAQRLALTAARVLTACAAVLAAGALLLSALGVWDRILGDGVDAGAAFGVGMAAYAVGLVPGLGQSMLLGVNRAHLTVVVLTFHIPLTAAGIGVAAALDAPSWAVIIMPALVLSLVRVALAAVSARVAPVRWGRLLRRLPFRRRHPGSTIRDTMGPALVIALSSPIARQSDRLVLSHFSTESAVASHAITMQLFAPLLGVVAAAAQPLWPIFSRAQARGDRGPRVGVAMLGFGAITAVISAFVVLVADPIGTLIGGDEVNLGLLTPIAAALLVAGQASIMPLSMAMKSAPALRFSAVCSVIALPLNIGLSVALADPLGAAGPLLASALVGMVVQVFPAVVWYRRHHGQSASPVPAGGPAAAAGPTGLDPAVEGLSIEAAQGGGATLEAVAPADTADAVPPPPPAWSHQLLGREDR